MNNSGNTGNNSNHSNISSNDNTVSFLRAASLSEFLELLAGIVKNLYASKSAACMPATLPSHITN